MMKGKNSRVKTIKAEKRTSVLCLIGTRPEAVKMAPVVKELKKQEDIFKTIVCATGQHQTMAEQVFRIFNIQPDADLNVMKPDQALSALTADLITALDRLILQEKPDWVLAQGDTTSVLAGAITAFYHHIPFGHVEAGLRTEDIRRPFPEEMNRRLADRAADLLFAPTEGNKNNLLKEGSPEKTIRVTGNTVVDALHILQKEPFDWNKSPLAGLPSERRLILVTVHRRESFGPPLKEICLAVRELARIFGPEGFHVVLPAHLNPRVRRTVKEILSGKSHISLLDPLDPLSFINLMKRSPLILTDSGGIQEEAPSLGAYVLVLRDTTERPEGIQEGTAALVGRNKDRIIHEASLFLESLSEKPRNVLPRKNPFGDGKSAPRIVAALRNGSA